MSTEAKPDVWDIFSNRFVQIILLSGLFLQAGIWVRNFAILLFVTDMTNDDPIAVSLISVAEFAPIFLFSFIGGTFADRWKPKRTMIWCDILSAVSIFVVLLTLMYGSWHAVFFATLVSSILSQFSHPSGMKLFKQHVPEALIPAGMSLYQSMFAIFMILGPILGTWIYFQFGINTAIGIMGVCFLLSAAVLFFLPNDQDVPRAERAKLSQEMALGFRYVLSKPIFWSLGGAFLTAGLALGLVSPMGIFFVTEQLGLHKDQLQWFMAVNGFAMFFGGALAIGFSQRIPPQVMLLTGMLVNACVFAVFGLTTVTAVALTAQFFSGLMMPAIQISINTMILKNTTTEFVGRVNGIMTPLFMGAMVVMMSAAGVLKSVFPLPVLYFTASALFILGVLSMLPAARAAAPVSAAQAE